MKGESRAAAPDVGSFFLPDLCRVQPLFLLVLAGVWTMLLRAIWRGRWLERFLGIDALRPEIDFSPQAPKKSTIVMEQVRSMTQAVKQVKI